MKPKPILNRLLLTAALCLLALNSWGRILIPTDCFLITALGTTASSVSFSAGDYLEYYIENGGKDDWTKWDGSPISLSAGQKMYVKFTNRKNDNFPNKLRSNHFIISSADGSHVAVSGDVGKLVKEVQMGENAFTSLFAGCTGITSAADLILNAQSSLTLTAGCYANMFQDCTNLTAAPALPATTLAESCYEGMFSGCTHLTAAPALPATTLAESCYKGMFSGCTRLAAAPELAVTTLASSCYESMFSGCTSLTTAPALPATVLVENCYKGMFSGCTSLNHVECWATDASAAGCTDGWLDGVASSGIIVCGPDTGCSTSVIPSGWTKQITYTVHVNGLAEGGGVSYQNGSYGDGASNFAEAIDPAALTAISADGYDAVITVNGTDIYVIYYPQGCFSITANAASTVSFSVSDVLLYLTSDVTEWTAMPQTNPADATQCVTLSAGQTMYVKGNAERSTLSGGSFSISGNVAVAGTLMTLLSSNKMTYEEGQGAFENLFAGCTGITTAAGLVLPNEVKEYCYKGMFSGCTSLTTAPALPAKDLIEGCYASMFSGCTSLTSVECLTLNSDEDEVLSAISSDGSSADWLKDVPNTGAFICDPSCNWEDRYIPAGWTTRYRMAKPADCFCITAIAASNVSFGNDDHVFLYSVNDEGIWDRLTSTVSLSAADKMYVSARPINENHVGDLTTNMSGKKFSIPDGSQVTLSGKLMTLLSSNEMAYDAYGAFESLFYDCKGIVSAEDLILPGTTTEWCYREMFYGCTNLTTAPVLGATTLAEHCYEEMFSGCKSLTTAPVLGATTLAESCCYGMFFNCTNLTTAPVLGATTLAEHCYENMFSYCTSLTTAPVLGATTLAESCYGYMFSGCTSLTTAPVLGATTLAAHCYEGMFYNCTNLNYVECWATDISATRCTNLWLSGVAATGAMKYNPSTAWTENSVSGIPSGWTKLIPITYKVQVIGLDDSAQSHGGFSYDNQEYGDNYSFEITDLDVRQLTAKAVEGYDAMFSAEGTNLYVRYYPEDSFCITANASSTVSLSASNRGMLLEYSTGSDTGWTEMPETTLYDATQCVTLSAGQKMLVRVRDGFGDIATLDGIHFSITGDVTISGDIMNLLNAKMGGGAFSGLFNGCAGITSAKDLLLPEVVKPECYSQMFMGCTNLAEAASLPALSLKDANGCYSDMFNGCTSLAAAPALPATTLAKSCYRYMFYGCTSLTAAPALGATTLAESCYGYMFSGCTSLTTAPALGATTLAESCYGYMFSGCTSLTTAPALGATTLAGNCCDHMFFGCTSLTAAPVLGATVLSDWCYNDMFVGCTSLNYVECWATDISATYCTHLWLYGVASSGILVCNPAARWTSASTSGIPEGWTTVNAPYSLTVGDKGWASLYLPFAAMVPEGATAYYADEVSGSTITLRPVIAGQVIPGGQGILVKADAGAYSFAPSLATPVTITQNYLVGYNVDTAITGSDAISYYALNYDDHGVGFFAPKGAGNPNGSFTAVAHKAYLRVPGNASGLSFRFGGETTSVEVTPAPTDDPAIYDLTGRRVEHTAPGIYIVNGRKTFIR